MSRTDLAARLWKYVKRGLVALLGVAVLAAAAVALTIRHYEAGLPGVQQLRTGYDPPQVTRILDRQGQPMASLFTERRTLVPISELPSHVKLAFLAAEDAQFYVHEGVNYFGMLRALYANLRAGKTRQGGSTITQQVVKNILLEPERTYERKIKETILARRLEHELTKDEIFSLYLNQIYFGGGRYGVEEAARYYFGKHARELTLGEAATIAGVVASPERFSPFHDPEAARRRRRYVLDQMRDKQFITAELYEKTSAEPDPPCAPRADVESELSPEIVSYVKKLLEDVVGARASHGGFTVTTTLDTQLQSDARKAVRAALERYAVRQKLVPPLTLDKRRLWGKPSASRPALERAAIGVVTAVDDRAGTISVRVGDVDGRVTLSAEQRYDASHLAPSAFTRVGALLRVALTAEPESGQVAPLRLELGPQAALVLIDARTREVRALVGSVEAVSGGLDRATRAHRQPGSAFKAFVYGYALRSRRFTPASMLELGASRDGKLPARRLSLRDALARSDNAAAQHVLGSVGAANVVDFARAAGIESKLGADLSLALGAYEVTPLELVNAYATLASGGEYAPPILISKILGPDGAEIALPPSLPRRRVLSAEEAYLTTSLLRSVISSGTAARAASLGRPLAGKTGTSNDARDAWFVGYSPELVAGVWVGYDDSMPLGWGEAGGVTALPAWMDLMKAALAKTPVTEFPRPPGVAVVKIDPATGLLAGPGLDAALDEEFLDGTAPTETSSPDGGADAGTDAAPDETASLDGGPVDLPAPSAAPADAGRAAPRPAPGAEGDGAARPEEPPPF